MEWFNQLLRPEVLSVIIPIIVIIAVFAITVVKANRKHQKRLDKIRNGFNPDL